MKRKLSLLVAVLVLLSCILSLGISASAATTDEVLIDESTAWKYLDDNTDPGILGASSMAWTQATFNDSYWGSGKGSFGSKNGKSASINGKKPDNLINLYQADGTTTIPTVFFRTNFTVKDLSKNNTLMIEAYADDAIVIYINGVRVRDSRSKTNKTTNMYYSSGDWDQCFELRLYEYDSLIRKGTNIIAVELHNSSETSSDLYFGMESMVLTYKEPVIVPAELITLTVGANESERNLAWFSNTEDEGEVRLALASDVVNGVFPDNYTAFTPTSRTAVNVIARYAKAATLKGLAENTRYAYVIEANGAFSDIHYFETGSKDNFDFVFVGDPQVRTDEASESWADTVNKITGELGTSFIISAGDQVDSPESESCYSNFVIDELSGVTLATSVGPGHESTSATFSDHYNLPNLSDKYGVVDASSNYWYRYGNTLFMHLNTSDTEAGTNGEHKKFMQEAMRLNPDAKWNIVVTHVSLYSTGPHGDEKSILNYRKYLAPIFSELKIDAVISGHDHVYTRTYMMDGNAISDDVVTDNTVYDPSGILYLCANSSTGSKFYEKENEGDFAAVENFEKRKSAIKFEITGDSIKMTSYFLDDLSVFDTFTIYKSDHICELSLVEGKPVTCDTNGKLDYYVCECGRTYEDAEGTNIIFDVKDWGIVEKLGHEWIAATCTTLRTCKNCGIERGKLLDHEWTPATCTSPSTCSVCGEADGDPLGHKYANACDKVCATCDEIREVGEHVDSDGNGECDECRAVVEVEKNFPVGLIVIISVGALLVAAAAIVVIKLKGKKATGDIGSEG